jgi:hypothetical protein
VLEAIAVGTFLRDIELNIVMVAGLLDHVKE